MSDVYRRAAVYVRNIYAGMLEETEEGYSFGYSPEYLASADPLPVSISLPLSGGAYSSKTLFPFFDGLIPEGWLLDIASRNWKLDRNDRFGLLLLCCNDCIGDVSVREPEDEV